MFMLFGHIVMYSSIKNIGFPITIHSLQYIAWEIYAGIAEYFHFSPTLFQQTLRYLMAKIMQINLEKINQFKIFCINTYLLCMPGAYFMIHSSYRHLVLICKCWKIYLCATVPTFGKLLNQKFLFYKSHVQHLDYQYFSFSINRNTRWYTKSI